MGFYVLVKLCDKTIGCYGIIEGASAKNCTGVLVYMPGYSRFKYAKNFSNVTLCPKCDYRIS